MYQLGHQSHCKVQNVNDLNFEREECSYPNPHHTMITHLRSVSEHTIFCCATKAKGTVFGLMLFCRLTPSCICNMSMDMVYMNITQKSRATSLGCCRPSSGSDIKE